MLKLFGGLATKFKPKKKFEIDTTISRLHYRITAIFLFACSVIVTANANIGNPIQCIHDAGKGDAKQYHQALNTYCWISSTFSLPKAFKGVVGSEVPYMGLGPYSPADEKLYRSYYQWVPFMLFLQGLMFYAPHFIWKSWEGLKFPSVLNGLETMNLEPGKRYEKMDKVCGYIKSRLGMHNIWFFKFLFCECLYLINVVGNIYLTDTFFQGQFLTYGSDLMTVVDEDPEDRFDPMSIIFPKVTKCTFHMYGASGTIQKEDALCVMAQNIINEKIYVFLWFWFIILAMITGLGFGYRLFSLIFPATRLRALKAYGNIRGRPNVLYQLNKYLHVGDWYLMVVISQNMDPALYSEFMLKLTKTLENEDVEPDEKSPTYPNINT